MSRTHKYNPCKSYSKERKTYRKKHYKAYRKKTNRLVKDLRWENLENYTKTSGWLTY